MTDVSACLRYSYLIDDDGRARPQYKPEFRTRSAWPRILWPQDTNGDSNGE